ACALRVKPADRERIKGRTLSDARRIAKNIALITGGGVFRAVLMPLFTIFTARELGTQGFGAFSFALSLASILVIVGEMGLPKMVVRELTNHREDVAKYIGDLSVLRLIAGVASMGIVAMILALTPRAPDTRIPLFLIGLSLLVFTGLRRFFDAIFQAFEVMKYQALVDMVDILLTFGVGTALLFSGYGLMGIAFAMMVGATISMAMDFIILTRKLGKPVFTFDLAFWKRMALGALPFGIIGVLTFLFGYSNTVLLSIFKGDEQAGLFSSAYRVIWMLAIIPATCMTAVFPFLARIGRSSDNRQKDAIRLVVKYLACLSLPFSGLLAIYAPQIISAVYGKSYSSAGTALWILAAIPLFSFAYIPLIDLMNSQYKQRFSVIAILLCAGINTALCLLLAPLLGMVGAAVSTLVAEACLFGITIFFSWKHMRLHPRIFNLWKPLVASLTAALGMLPLRNVLPLPMMLIAFFLVYLAALLLLRTFDMEDRKLLGSLLPAKSGPGGSNG
ncbi:MAG: flippase, partial [Actinomycetota bacterium]|nr:flippase [Actinomycetota bacterium]